MKISQHCYAIQGLFFSPPWSVNAGFIVGSQKTLIVDTGSNCFSAQTIYGYAKAVAPENGIIVINTEKHLDHIGGNSFFRDQKIDIMGHKLIQREVNDIELMKQYFNDLVDNEARKNAHEGAILFEGSSIENPNIPIDSEMEIDLGDMTANMIFTPGHTETNISIYIPEDNVLFCGDTIVNQFIPNLEEGNAKNWEQWLSSLDKIKNISPQIIVPGHGHYLKNKTEIKGEIERTEAVLQKAIQEKKASTAG